MNARAPLEVGEPTSVLIAALGGQGGGVLAGWIVRAARAQGLVAQATSTPGVSQRTGATTYYVEIADKQAAGASAPVLGLAPVPGRVDVLVCSELLEAARMLERGMATPSRTLVVASTHRVYTTREKMSGDDGRFDPERIVAAARALARRAVLFDMDAVRARHRAAISASLFGALAGSGVLPLSRAACEDAIRAAGIGVASSLAAFDEAFARAAQGGDGWQPHAASTPPGTPAAGPFADRVAALPCEMQAFAREAVAQLAAYQDDAYAARYLDRVEVVAQSAAGRGTRAAQAAGEATRCLALWMAYDDLVKVAAAKSRASRFARIRREAGAGDDDVVRVYDFFHPGAREVAAILPRPLGEWLERRAADPAQGKPAGRRLTLQTSSFVGALAMRAVAAMRPLRPHSLRFAREQAAIDEWLALLRGALFAASHGDPEQAMALARLPRLVKGYGETHAGGVDRFRRALATYAAGGSVALDAVEQATACGSGAPREPRAQPIVWIDQR